ncbi:hypothetical protein EJ05DRAFT_514087 [Pseudovirgaria hyperparasitica]|uniref:S-adenosyl-L-methionine-dependent methyltransferase n=1 Tax=Pseudovirgaria hyperparasitica TaxID=470096 RepID=A0A6A6VYA3_9PEZI|nr:uncharacterized protein EJ05DRAFT_514087 [Pseudovirgaria hyperparasitica]KAF2754640.1 hypothetical protein EJ05DRAFT_514087 [Pseudovirgaria hyperparasitica]
MANSEQNIASDERRDSYTLQRNFQSSIRLNAQHYLWKDAVGYNIHPRIPVLDCPTFKIADIGTGTAIWVTDVKREYPRVQVDGFDLNLKQAPAVKWMPHGTSLITCDARKPPDPRFQHQYDIVNIRLFLAVVENNDPSIILDHALRLLKPGGWIQWSEHVMSDISCKSAQADTIPPHCAMEELAQFLQRTNLGRWVPELPKLFAERNFTEAEMYKYPILPHTRLFWTQMQFNSTMDYTFMALDNDTSDSAGPQAREMIARAVEETQRGIALDFIPTTTVAQLPLTWGEGGGRSSYRL